MPTGRPLHEVQLADAVLVLGEDVTNTAPLLALALRQSVRRQPCKIAEKMHIPHWNDHAVREAVQGESGPLFIAALAGTRLDDIATQTFRGTPDELARLGFAVAHALDSNAPPVPDLPDAMRELVHAISEALKTAERPLVISGVSCGNAAVIEAAANVAWALCNTGRPAELCFAVDECNSLGAAIIGGAGSNPRSDRCKIMPMALKLLPARLSSLKTIFISAPMLRWSTGSLPPPGTWWSSTTSAMKPAQEPM